MTAQDTLHEAKFEEASALRRMLRDLQTLADRLEAENHALRLQLQAKKPLKVGPPQHPGQLSIGGTEETK